MLHLIKVENLTQSIFIEINKVEVSALNVINKWNKHL